jgi:rubrerythrin
MSDYILVFERQVLSLALVEKELYQLYTTLSEKVEDLSAKTLFSYIATDSLKHSTILSAIIDEVDGSKARELDCEMNIIYNKELIKTLSKDIAKKERISREELISLIDTLAGFENLLFNEYKKAFHLEYRGFSKNEPDKNDETDLNILTLIVGDEERHQRILSAIVTLCDKKLSFKQDAPIVKYHNPDSWYVPPRKHRP